MQVKLTPRKDTDHDAVAAHLFVLADPTTCYTSRLFRNPDGTTNVGSYTVCIRTAPDSADWHAIQRRVPLPTNLLPSFLAAYRVELIRFLANEGKPA